MLMNEGTKINIKTIMRIIKSKNLQLPYGKHKNKTNNKKLARPSDINRVWEIDIHYVIPYNGMPYLMAVKDGFSKRFISYNFSKICTAKDCVKSMEEAYAISYNNSKLNNLVLMTYNGP